MVHIHFIHSPYFVSFSRGATRALDTIYRVPATVSIDGRRPPMPTAESRQWKCSNNSVGVHSVARRFHSPTTTRIQATNLLLSPFIITSPPQPAKYLETSFWARWTAPSSFYPYKKEDPLPFWSSIRSPYRPTFSCKAPRSARIIIIYFMGSKFSLFYSPLTGCNHSFSINERWLTLISPSP